jgi:hypothetical protein
LSNGRAKEKEAENLMQTGEVCHAFTRRGKCLPLKTRYYQILIMQDDLAVN